MFRIHSVFLFFSVLFLLAFRHCLQQSAELQAALQAQKLENEVLQKSVQNEILKQQLAELQRQNTLSPPVIAPPPQFGSRPQLAPSPAPQVVPIVKKQPPVPAKQKSLVNGDAPKRAVTFALSAPNGELCWGRHGGDGFCDD